MVIPCSKSHCSPACTIQPSASASNRRWKIANQDLTPVRAGVDVKRIERAVVLAAGLGTRLKWLTTERPKALMRVHGEPVIAHVIRRLVAQGVREIAVNAHHHAEQLQRYLGDGSAFGCHVVISHEPSLLDSGGGVKQALALLPGDGPVAVWNADVLSDIDVQALAGAWSQQGAMIALVANPDHHPHGDFGLEHGRVVADGSPRYTFAGVSVWDAGVFEAYGAGDAFSLTVPMRRLIAAGDCSGKLHHGEWFDIGRPRDLLRASRHQGR
ncbi:nucleotidyltransferase family protein [Mariprofundus erugo]|uniref:Nucleotidyltransferase family protein n=1 Tax=Mariprofundus erugo TaxID=2528639 RepID=A0A5R9GNQ2_9PROT|nr:nucleotidyltransferase family protein [Mariprofundus erugo]